MVGRALARRQPRLGLGGDLLCQHLHQARFPDPRFAAEQHDLSKTVLGLRPTLPQQPALPDPAPPAGSTRCCGGFQATAGHTLIEHAIDRQRLRVTLQWRGP